MKTWKLLAAALAAGAVALCGPALAADNYTVKDSTGATKTICSKDASGVHATCHVTVNADGSTKIDPATSGLQTTANTKLDTLHTDMGAQGTGSTYNPPTGGSGLMGYLSGIFKAVTGTLQVGGATSNGATGVATSSTNVPAVAFNYVWSGTAWERADNSTATSVSQSGTWTFTQQAPTSGTGVPVPANGSSASGSTTLVVKATPGNLISWGCHAHATAGNCILMNRSSAPSAGSLTAAEVIRCRGVAANSDVDDKYAMPGMRMSVGVVVIFSSSTDCGTYTASSTAHLFGLAQ